MRRSLFGYFCRRCFVSFIKLSFSGVVDLQRNYHLWRSGESEAGYGPMRKDQLNHSKRVLLGYQTSWQWVIQQTFWFSKHKRTKRLGRSPKHSRRESSYDLITSSSQVSFQMGEGWCNGRRESGFREYPTFFRAAFSRQQWFVSAQTSKVLLIKVAGTPEGFGNMHYLT